MTTPLPRLHAWSRGWSDVYRRWRDEARERAELAGLDEDALRDLGISRSELGSFDAESRPGAWRTRRRVARHRALRR
ncbi:MAG: DUF1127 domain-containing protein [Variovorax sp.]